MKQSWVLTYHRRTGHLDLERFTDSGSAFTRRLELDREHRGNPDIETVVLRAGSVDELKTTHGRYFLNSLREAATSLDVAASA